MSEFKYDVVKAFYDGATLNVSNSKVKSILKTIRPLIARAKHSHLLEALAHAMGYGKYSTLKYHLEVRGNELVALDFKKFHHKLKHLQKAYAVKGDGHD